LVVGVFVLRVGIVVRTAAGSSRVGRRDNRDHRQQQSEERGKKKGCRLHFNVSFLWRAALCHSAALASVSVVLLPSRAINLPRNRDHTLCKPLQSCSPNFLSRHERALTLGTTARRIDLTHAVRQDPPDQTRLKIERVTGVYAKTADYSELQEASPPHTGQSS
jgi:hypothetical protein